MNHFRPFFAFSACALTLLALASCTPNAATTSPDGSSITDASAASSATSNEVTNEVANEVTDVANDVANDAPDSTTTEAFDTPNSTPAPASTPVAKSADKNAPDEKYRVAEAPANYPPALQSALKKVAVPRPPAATKVPDVARVRLVTSKGNIEVQLHGKAAPLHVKSFLHLSGRGFYNGTKFHRYEPGFVIQGGDPLTRSADTAQYAGVGGPGYEVPREYNSFKHDAMVLAAARTQDPNSAGSQFYFTLQDTPFLDKAQSQDGVGYTVYGKVLKGKDVVLKLRADDTLKQVVILAPKP